MNRHSCNLALLAVIAAGMLPAAAAQAQSYGTAYAQPAPLYPYPVPPNQPYAIQVAPNTYVIQRPGHTRAYHYAHCHNCIHRAGISPLEPATPRFDRLHGPVHRGLIEELRKRSQTERRVVNTTKIVRHPLVVVETERYVDNPPHVIERRHVVADAPLDSHARTAIVEESESSNRSGRDDGKKRVFRADAEIIILGPDRMNIRLFRKGPGAKAKAAD
jgi:hypothetical protein